MTFKQFQSNNCQVKLNDIIEDHFGKIYEEAHRLVQTKGGDISYEETDVLDEIALKFLNLLNIVLKNNL